MPLPHPARVAAVLLASCSALAVAAPAASAEYLPTRASLDRHVVPAWYSDAKLGIFVQWNGSSVPAYAPTRRGQRVGGFPYTGVSNYAEWYWRNAAFSGSPQQKHHARKYGARVTYDDLVKRWKGERFEPRRWLQLFKDAGAKYFVLVAKHHDGVALWPSKVSDRTTVKMGPRRDVAGELMKEARRFPSLRPGLYYSITEWFNPAPNPSLTPDAEDSASNSLLWKATAPNLVTGKPVPYTGYKPVSDYAKGLVVPQIRELIRRYKPQVLWCDIGGDADYYQSNRWISELYNTVGDRAVVNDRCGRTAHSDYTTPEYSIYEEVHREPWEATRGLGFSFGFNAEEERNDNYVSSDYLIAVFTDIVAKGGNLLLNVGPRADGTISPKQASRLRDLGRWIRVNGQAIRGSRPWTQARDDGQALDASPERPGPDQSTLAPGDRVVGFPFDKPTGTRFTVKPRAFYILRMGWPGSKLRVRAAVPVREGDRLTLLGNGNAPLRWTREGGGLVVSMP
ncbi:MAG: GH29, partial [uncultured Solirubrobacteraceae bacterium]